MWSIITNWFFNKDEVAHLLSSVNQNVISDAFSRRRHEIESLRLYDIGEKEIDAPNLRATVSNLF